ncbi:MAG: DUF4292 domain-containing protein [Flavobacteriales bacterium]
MKRNYRPLDRSVKVLPFLFGLLLLSACKDRPIEKTSEEKPSVTPLDTLSQLPPMGLERSRPFSFDLKVKAETPQKKRRIKANMRMKPDSLIWGSVAPAFGFEMARILLSDDSLSFLDRMNDRYYKGSPEGMTQRFGFPANRDLLESALLGKPAISYDNGFLLYPGNADTLLYRPLMNPELKRFLDIGTFTDPYEKAELPPRSMSHDTLESLRNKGEGELRYLPFFWASDSGKVMSRFTVIDLEKRSVLKIRYKSYEKLDSASIPSKIEAKVRSPQGISTFEIGIEGASGSDSLNYPFVVPDDYAPIRP